MILSVPLQAVLRKLQDQCQKGKTIFSSGDSCSPFSLKFFMIGHGHWLLMALYIYGLGERGAHSANLEIDKQIQQVFC